MKKLAHIREELRAHLPYTIFSSAFGLIMVGIFKFCRFFLDEARFRRHPPVVPYLPPPVHVLFRRHGHHGTKVLAA